MVELCGVDRTAAILPWGTELNEKFSPVAASALYLRHLLQAWNATFSQGANAAARSRTDGPGIL